MGVTGLNQNRKVKYKEEKFKREKLKREAAREVKARELAKMFGTEYVPETSLTEEELKKKREDAKEKLKAERRVSRAKKAALTEEKEAAKMKRREEKVARRAQKKENKRRTAEAIAALKSKNLAAGVEETTKKELGTGEQGSDGFAGGADEVKLGINVDGRVRRIPGVGRVEKYPSKKEKLRTKIEARAFEAGITFEEMEARMTKEKEEKMAPEKQRVAMLRTHRGGLTARQWHRYCFLAESESQEEAEKFFVQAKKKNDDRAAAAANGSSNGQPSSEDSDDDVEMGGVSNRTSAVPALSTVANGVGASELRPISDKRLKKYTKKAAKKGITVEAYIAKKEAKRLKKDNFRGEAEATAGATAPKPVAFQLSGGIPGGKSKADSLLAAAKAAVLNNNVTPAVLTPCFVVDTDGDPHLNSTTIPTADVPFIIDPSGDPDILTRPRTPLIWHPDMLGDRKIKELSKEERRARLEYMRQKRAARHADEGKTPLSKKERHKLRIEKKSKHQNRLVFNIMTEKGKSKEEVTQDELEDARRAAKKIMREEKRFKRDKVIHRKKLGGGLRGQFGGAISVG
jgi:hypothetical protein